MQPDVLVSLLTMSVEPTDSSYMPSLMTACSWSRSAQLTSLTNLPTRPAASLNGSSAAIMDNNILKADMSQGTRPKLNLFATNLLVAYGAIKCIQIDN